MPSKKRQGVCKNCGKNFTFMPGRGRPPGFCSEKCRIQRQNQRTVEWRHRTEIPEEAHGTLAGYATYLCSCERCRKAEAEYMRERRKKGRK